MKRILAVLLVLTFVFGIAAAPVRSQGIDRASTVIFDIDGGRVQNPDLWNYFVPGARRDHGFHQALMEPLFILNYESGQIEPWLGKSMTANATLDVWTLELQAGAYWSDGKPITADDVVFTLQMLLDRQAPDLGYAAEMQTWVASVTKTGDLTVEFKLKKANPRFQLDYFSVRIWGSLSIVPKHIWEGQDPLTFKNYDPAKGWPVFSGAYKLKSISETEFTYERDDNWWGAKVGFKPLPAPKTLIWTWAGPEETRAALMADNGLDSLMDVTLGAFEALIARNDKVIAWQKAKPFAWLDPCPRNFEFNTTVAPWDDKEMRWAINYAINRDEILNIAYEGTTIPSKFIFPAYPPLNRFVDLMEKAGVYERNPLWTYDAAKAEQIIQSKGYVKGSDGYYAKDGKQLSMDIQTHEAFIEKQRIAQVIVEQLQRIGINATNRNVAGATFDDNYQRGNFETRMAWYSCGSVNEPWASMDTLSGRWVLPVGERADFNGWRWNNADYTKMVEEIGSLPLGDAKLDELVVKAGELLLNELPVIPITQAKKLIPFNNTYWTNWPSADNNYLHATTWWQSTHIILVNLKPAQ
jgi:peptide/nickel transport system substrate-binding protein